MLASIRLLGTELGQVAADRVLPDGRSLPDSGPAITPEVLERLTAVPAGTVALVEVLDEHHGTAGRVRIHREPDVVGVRAAEAASSKRRPATTSMPER